MFSSIYPDNDSQDACSLHHQKTQSPGLIPRGKKQAFAHNTTERVSAQPAPQLSPVIMNKIPKNNVFMQLQQFHTM